MRQNYRNGHEITLKECGCDGCSPARINGVLCHELGCEESWRDHSFECSHCGCDFFKDEAHQELCNDCIDFFYNEL